MAIEITAGRLIAPYLGVSLYTWTTVIGVVLAGISVGSYLGGRIADGMASRKTLGVIFLVSGLSVLSIVLTVDALPRARWLQELSLFPRIVLVIGAIFFVPSLILGTISPVVIRLSVKDLARTGGTVGTVYAWSTMGSLVGTFATGFLLIEIVGSRGVIWLAAATLLMLGGLVGAFWRNRNGQAALGACLLAFGFAFTQRGNLQAPCLQETSYYCIDVRDRPVEDDTIKALVLDNLVHSLNSLHDPTHLEYGYERIYAEVTEYVATDRSHISTLTIGGGGYTFPRYLEAVYPRSTVEVIEIDPVVTAIAYRELGLSPTSRVRSYNQDARQFFIKRQPRETYDIVYGDAFNDLSIPYHLVTYEFNELVKRSLRRDGYYLANVIDDLSDGSFLRAYVTTLRLSFSHVYVLGDSRLRDRYLAEGSRSTTPLTFVVLASARPLDWEDVQRQVGRAGKRSLVSDLLPSDFLDAYLKRGRPIVLTDDYAPVDNLLAPVFVKRGY